MIESELVFKALSSFNIKITNYNEAFYVFAAFNLLNRAVKDKDKYNISYDFKKHIEDKIIELIDLKLDNVEVFLDTNVCYIKFIDYQFSFHNVNYGEELMQYKNSSKNKYQEWSQIRLQEKAFDIFKEAVRRIENDNK